jgi:hypothetical protein
MLTQYSHIKMTWTRVISVMTGFKRGRAKAQSKLLNWSHFYKSAFCLCLTCNIKYYTTSLYMTAAIATKCSLDKSLSWPISPQVHMLFALNRFNCIITTVTSMTCQTRGTWWPLYHSPDIKALYDKEQLTL